MMNVLRLAAREGIDVHVIARQTLADGDRKAADEN
jgi:hypothetical protein